MIKALLRGALLGVCLILWTAPASALQYAAVVMDARTGKILHSRHADTQIRPASLTKMMTLYIVFDQIQRGKLSENQLVRISRTAAAEQPSKLGLKEGQRIALRYLIRAAAVKSANDAATALAELVGGSKANFAKIMNAYAQKMGLSRTTFRNPHGLTQSGHVSTARDMANLGRRMVYDFPQYYNLFSRRSTSAGIKTVRNTNRRLLNAYSGADGIKTGYTRASGFNLVSSAERGSKRVIVAVIGGRSSASRNAEVARLMDLGFSRMSRRARLNKPARVSMQINSNNAIVAARSTTGSTAAIRTSRASLPSQIRSPYPRPRPSDTPIARSSETIASLVAEVDAEFSASTAFVQAAGTALAEGMIAPPRPRPAGARIAAASGLVASDQTSAGSASTFMSQPAAVMKPPARLSHVENLALTAAPSTGGNKWGVQIGVHRAKKDAERQLLALALRDVPQLAGGLRRVEPAKISGVTVYRAQFVGLSQQNAVSACQALANMKEDCAPIAPGT